VFLDCEGFCSIDGLVKSEILRSAPNHSVHCTSAGIRQGQHQATEKMREQTRLLVTTGKRRAGRSVPHTAPVATAGAADTWPA
jgi:hypothetical protein